MCLVLVLGWCRVVVTISVCGECGMGHSVHVQSTWVNTTHWTSLMWRLRREILPISVLMIEHCE